MELCLLLLCSPLPDNCAEAAALMEVRTEEAEEAWLELLPARPPQEETLLLVDLSSFCWLYASLWPLYETVLLDLLELLLLLETEEAPFDLDGAP